jgi:selenide,water dikinase
LAHFEGRITVRSVDAVRADLVLVGGGHTHIQVLRRWAMAPIAGVRVTVVLDRPEAVYSGMVPGFVAGDYAAHELAVDVVPLARRARARVMLAPAISVDAQAHRIELEGRPPVVYDVASLDVGATVRGLDLPGVRKHAFATRPIARLVEELDARIAALPDRPRVAIVGGGAAGVELSFTLDARLRASRRTPDLHLVTQDAALLDDYGAWLRRRVDGALAERGISVHTGVQIGAVHAGGIDLGSEPLCADLVVWATGAAPLPFPCGPGLPLDEDGFVLVERTLEVAGCPDLFAVGDCAALPFAPWVRKAGVYAVREGPALDANLRARLSGGQLRTYRPQRDFLALLNLGGGEAIAAKWGAAFRGRAAWRLKDWIDRRFVERFRVLDETGAPAASAPPEMAGAMECGGCAAKVSAPALSHALARLPKAPADASVRIGLAEADDAALVATPRGDALLASIDAFRAFTDDPWWVGRVAAVNAVSDVFAKGGRARHALALVNVPEADPRRAEETLFQVLAGMRTALDPLGVSLVGGHTTQGGELYVGLAITGELAGEPLPAGGLAAGQRLVLSKPLGSGVLLAADMRGLLPGERLAPLYEGLARANADAARVAREFGATGCTDVTGFGLAGHLAALLRASRASACLFARALPAWPGTRELLARGVRSTYHDQNASLRDAIAVAAGVGAEDRALIFDPQTSGGLLFGVDAARAVDAVQALRAAGDGAATVIGIVGPPRADRIVIELVLNES